MPQLLDHQRCFDDLGTPLHQVTFCVVDLETTGASPTVNAITEFGAVKVRGGECLGTFQSLVNPEMAIPPEIVVLTGITDFMVIPAPPVHTVLAAFLEPAMPFWWATTCASTSASSRRRRPRGVTRA